MERETEVVEGWMDVVVAVSVVRVHGGVREGEALHAIHIHGGASCMR
jgi:hypothetical protein